MEHVLTGKKPRLIDEWQEVPAIWDGVRYRVDQVKSKGQYLLTGSSTPNDLAKIHSGAGRFGRVLLQTMSVQEMGISTGEASLKKLLQGKFPSQKLAIPGKLKVAQIASLVSKGGWPGLVSSSVKASLETLRGYVDILAREDMSKIDGSRRDPAKIMALLQSLARNTATLVKKETIRNDIAQFSSFQVDANTVGEYRRVEKLNELRDGFKKAPFPSFVSDGNGACAVGKFHAASLYENRPAVSPPSILISAPVTHLASSEARKTYGNYPSQSSLCRNIR
jgi:predicted AAA+ superfamily ATPase